MELTYTNKLIVNRIRPSTITRKSKIDEFYSDRSRIIYCSSFRRLQQKAQVFSLESNASVRTRMTHTLEVSDLGRTLANRIAQKLQEKKLITIEEMAEFVSVVENACFLHDIGNPPFGHFGEAAIQDWSQKNLFNLPSEDIYRNKNFQSLMYDFYEFDGNPQGFRTVTKLHTETDEHGLNLTYATLLCILKYSRAAGDDVGTGILKKAGYFLSEKELVEKIYKESNLELKHRFPLTYIMEAADDIAYCMSDIADGIEKRLVTSQEFISEFKKEWKKEYGVEPIPVELPKKVTSFNVQISIPWSKIAIEEAAENYINNHELFYKGIADELIPQNNMGKVLGIVKRISRKILYSSIEAESIELTGYAVITGILKHYESILKIPYNDFSKLINCESLKGYDLEKRLLNRIGEKYVKAYQFAIKKLKRDKNFSTFEWWLRVHMIIDHISGMTDDFALKTYQMLEGINLMKF